MKREEFDNIVTIIENDFKTRNIENLIELRDLLDSKIEILKLLPNDEQQAILLEKVIDFCRDNCDENIKPSNSRFNKMLWAMYYELSNDELIDTATDIRVYQTLGLDKNKLIKFQNLGMKTIDNYENMLNKYNLSMNQVLLNEEYNKLKELHRQIKENENIKVLERK